MSTLEAPQDRQIHTQDGASRVEQTDGGQGGAGSSGGQGRWSFVAVASSLGPATTAGTFVPPQKKSMGYKSQMPQSPEKSTALLDTVNIGLPFGTVQF